MELIIFFVWLYILYLSVKFFDNGLKNNNLNRENKKENKYYCDNCSITVLDKKRPSKDSELLIENNNNKNMNNKKEIKIKDAEYYVLNNSNKRSFDSLFKEENYNLNIKLNVINNEINKILSQIKFFNKEMDSCRNDYEYLADFQYFKRLKERYQKDLEKIRKTKKTPYFGRMILNDSQNDLDIYIGESSVFADNKIIVFDWRAEVSSLFYQNQTIKKYNEYNYELIMKREIKIDNSKLIAVRETYNNGTSFGINDSFLLEVLEENSHKKGFKDIIKTIQAKQNEIIRLALDENILCQGVAGSGKTVIMLHRISYLLYNYKNITEKDFLFIAPSNIFKNEIKNIDKKIEIENINILTLYEYYIEKVNYFLNVGYFNSKNKNKDDEENYQIKLRKIIDDPKDSDVKKYYDISFLNLKYEEIKIHFEKYLNKIKNIFNLKIEKQETIVEEARIIYKEIKKIEEIKDFIFENNKYIETYLKFERFNNINFNDILIDKKNI